MALEEIIMKLTITCISLLLCLGIRMAYSFSKNKRIGSDQSQRAIDDLYVENDAINVHRTRVSEKKEIHGLKIDKKLCPHVIEAHNLKQQGNEALKQGDLHKALEFYCAGIEKDPTNEKIFSNRSYIYLLLGKNKKALSDANKTISLASKWPVGYLRKGMAEMKKGDLRGSLNSLEYASRLEKKLGHVSDPRVTQALTAVRLRLSQKAVREEDESVLSSLINPFDPSKPFEKNNFSEQNARKMMKIQGIVMRAHILRDTKKDFTGAAKMYHKAAQMGNAEAMFSLSHLYLEGKGVEQSNQLYLQWARKAANEPPFSFGGIGNLGVAHAENSLGCCFRDGIAVSSSDEEEALYWFHRSAEHGFCNGQNNLACILLDRGNLDEAWEWFLKAAEQGYPRAMCNLADILRTGKGRPRDVFEARRWLQKAAELGDNDAPRALASMAACGEHGEEDLGGALEILEKYQPWEKANAANLCHLAMLRMLRAREQPHLKDSDFNCAKKYLMRACNLGDNAQAFLMLGKFHVNRGDYFEAIKVLETGAKKGYSDVMLQLSREYSSRKETWNSPKALKWLNKAVETGSEEARSCYKDMCSYLTKSQGPPHELLDIISGKSSGEKQAKLESFLNKVTEKYVDEAEQEEMKSMNKTASTMLTKPPPSLHGVVTTSPLFMRVLAEMEQLFDYCETHPSSMTARKLLDSAICFGQCVHYFEASDQSGVLQSLFDCLMNDEKIIMMSPGMGLYSFCASMCNKVLSSDPNNVEALTIRSWLMIDIGDTRQLNEAKRTQFLLNAISAAEYLQNQTPKALSRLHGLLGSSYAFTGEWKQALKSFTTAGNLNPEDVGLLYSKAACYFQLGDQAKAHECYESFVMFAYFDDYKLPEAFWSLALISILENKDSANDYILKAQKAEKDRLWLFDPIDENFPAKVTTLLMKQLPKKVGLRDLSSRKKQLRNVVEDASVKCLACEKTPEILHSCKGCGKAFYCNRDCQKRHWKIHKKKCKKH